MMEELLHILEKNARLPVEDIAAMMGKTPAQVATMMDEAVAKGYIRGFEAMIDWEQAGINVVEAVIELHVSPRKSRGFDEIASVIASFDEVDSVLLMSGSYDLQVIIKATASRKLPCLWQSAFLRWTMYFPRQPALCYARISAAASCT